MSVFKIFTIISSGLLSCSSAVALASWQEIYYQPAEALVKVQITNWEAVIKSANDKLFDLKVETGIIPAPVS
ncbi:MAG: hypothetical protein KME11_21375 [Timaviella obliquedivisa GSE-PSE-MK23-08B]|jgi:hypothetical protein|nr:hypothetical protein [Timaviella obliquedivisa GSE-PSE-MK23-08B]